jgi:anti-anti-sigma factor
MDTVDRAFETMNRTPRVDTLKLKKRYHLRSHLWLCAMADKNEPILNVYEAGPTTVVGFGDRKILDDVNLALCREQLVELLKSQNSHTLGFDLTGVKLVPSGFLGLMASVRGLGVEVHLYNPSPDVREVLSTTNLDRIMPVHEVEIPAKKVHGE